MTIQAITNTELPRPDNLTDEEWKALHELEKIRNIVIKPADKGGGIVVINRTDYDNKVRALFYNKNHYALTDSNPLPKLINDIVTYTTHLFLSGRIVILLNLCPLIQADVCYISVLCPKSTSRVYQADLQCQAANTHISNLGLC